MMCSSLLTVSALLTPPRIATSSNSLLSTKFEQLQSDYGDDGARCLWRHLRTGRDPASSLTTETTSSSAD